MRSNKTDKKDRRACQLQKVRWATSGIVSTDYMGVAGEELRQVQSFRVFEVTMGGKDVLDVLPVRTIIRAWGQDVESVVSVHASKNVRFLDETNPCTQSDRVLLLVLSSPDT